MIKTLPGDIWNEYQKGTEYLYKNNVYDIVKQNENFYIGKHWDGLEKTSMPTPTINMIQRCVKHLIASVSSNDVAVSLTPFTSVVDDIERMRPISKEVESVIERAKIKEKNRIIVRNSAVDGCGYMLLTFNPEIETNQDFKGDIEAEIIDNTNVLFGNPYSPNIQKQPYILIVLRQHISQVKKEAEEYGVSKDVIASICADNDNNYANDDSDNLVTVILKFFKKKDKVVEQKTSVDLEGNQIVEEIVKEEENVWFTKCTKDVTLIEPTNLGYKRYPLSAFVWENMKNSYLGISPVTQQIQNQIFLNKTYGSMQLFVQQNATPKVVYDKNKVNIDKLMNSTSPQAVASLDMAGKYLDFIKSPDFSSNALAFAQDVISQMKDTMGTADVDLGNVRPDNTSAIIALQEASSSSLEIQRQFYFEFNEDTVRNIIDIMACSFGVRQVMTENNELAVVDFNALRGLNYELKVDVGQGSQYSEIAQINTLNSLAEKGLPLDLIIELMPSKLVLGKNKILDYLRNQNAMMPPIEGVQK